MKSYFTKFWQFLKKDTWQSWLVSLILTFVVIKYVFFPILSFALGTSLPLVVVESCSMYHSTGDFEQWWNQNGVWYSSRGISKENFNDFSFRGGLNKGDIVIVSGRASRDIGNVIIFNSDYTYPIIHRVVSQTPLQTKGDNNGGQLSGELDIEQERVVGTAVARIPGLGWAKLIFFEGFKPKEQRGFC